MPELDPPTEREQAFLALLAAPALYHSWATECRRRWAESYAGKLALARLLHAKGYDDRAILAELAKGPNG